MLPPVLNVCSDAMLVAQMHKYLRARLLSIGTEITPFSTNSMGKHQFPAVGIANISSIHCLPFVEVLAYSQSYYLSQQFQYHTSLLEIFQAWTSLVLDHNLQ